MFFGKTEKIVAFGLHLGSGEKVGLQFLPLLPTTEVLFSDVGCIRELVEWTVPTLKRKDIDNG